MVHFLLYPLEAVKEICSLLYTCSDLGAMEVTFASQNVLWLMDEIGQRLRAPS